MPREIIHTAGIDIQGGELHQVSIPGPLDPRGPHQIHVSEPLDAREPGWQPPAPGNAAAAPEFTTLEQLRQRPNGPSLEPSAVAFEDALSLAFWLRQQCQGNVERMLAAVNGVHALLAEAQGEEIFRFERTDHPSMVEASH